MNKKRNIILLLTIFVLTFSIGLGTSIISSQAADVLDTIASEYKIGTQIQLPDYYFEDGSTSVKATKTIVCPDGSEHRADSFVPETLGKYTVNYSAVVGGKYKTESKEFYAYGDLFEVGASSSYFYGTNHITPNTNGLNVALQTGQKFTYNKVIDLAELGTNPFISLYMAPAKITEADGFDFFITLTDAYDPTNFIKIRVCNTSEATTYAHFRSYISAGSAEQPLLGYEKTTGKFHIDTNWGFDQSFTFYGCNTAGEPAEKLLTSKSSSGQLQLFFDLENKALLTQGNATSSREVTDFDNPKYYSTLWNGFTTGEVYLTVTPGTVYSTYMNFVFTEIAGNDLTDNKLIDTVAPYIAVDTLGYTQLPHAIVGQEYPVFPVKSQDAYCGEVDTEVFIYRNYGSPSQADVAIYNGKFIPHAVGNYDIVYTATDYSGNEGKVVVRIVADAAGEAVLLNVAEEEIRTQVNVGEYMQIPKANTTGGNGNVDIKVDITQPDGSIATYNAGDIIHVIQEGNYTVNYTATDFVGTKDTYSYEFSAQTSSKPVFAQEPVFSKYFLSGYEYVLPEYKAYDYSNGGKEVYVDIKIQDDDGERTLGADRKAIFNVNDVGAVKTFTVKYEATNRAGTITKTYEVKVINTKKLIGKNQRLDVSKYFYSDDVAISATETKVSLAATSDGKVEFVNPLLVSSFAADIEMTKTSTLGALKITLEDSENSTNRVELMLSKINNQNTKCKVVGGQEWTVGMPYLGGIFTLGYDANTKMVVFNSTNSVALTNADGSEFTGFKSGKIRLFFEFVGVDGESIISVSRLNAQNLNSSTVIDRVSPRIVVLKEQTSRGFNVNDVITVSAAISADVISPSVNLTVTVTDPDNKVVTSIDGIALSKISPDREYQFVATKYGTYKINYVSIDASENEQSSPVIINILDKEAPIVKLNYEAPTTAKKGSIIVLASATITDNRDVAEDCYFTCFVYRPSGTSFIVDMKDSNSFYATEVGEYLVRYMSFDQSGNIAVVERIVTVTE